MCVCIDKRAHTCVCARVCLYIHTCVCARLHYIRRPPTDPGTPPADPQMHMESGVIPWCVLRTRTPVGPPTPRRSECPRDPHSGRPCPCHLPAGRPMSHVCLYMHKHAHTDTHTHMHMHTLVCTCTHLCVCLRTESSACVLHRRKAGVNQERTFLGSE